MIQTIILILFGIWLAWGLCNVLWGILQILGGALCGIAAIVLYVVASLLEFVGYIVRKIR